VRPWATGNLAVRVDVEGCPCVDATFAEGALAPGLPRIIEITAGARAPGEWLGSINITARSTAPPPPPEEDEEEGEEGEGEGDVEYYQEGYYDDDDDGDSGGGGEGGGRGRHGGGGGGGGGGGTEWGVEQVYVPVYFNCVAKEREVMTRAGSTLGISGYVRGATAGAARPSAGAAAGKGEGPHSAAAPRMALSAQRSRSSVDMGQGQEQSPGGAGGGGGGGGGGAGPGRPVSAPIHGPTSFRRDFGPNISAELKSVMKQPRVSSARVAAAPANAAAAAGSAPGTPRAAQHREGDTGRGVGRGGGGGVHSAGARPDARVMAEAAMAQATLAATDRGPHRPPSGRAVYRGATGGLRY